MSFSVFLRIQGTKNKKIIAGPPKITDVVGREGEISLKSFTYGAIVPTEKLAPSGQRQHQPITFTKAIDQSSPILLQMLCTGEPIDTAEFAFYAVDAHAGGIGGEKITHKFIATGGQIVGYDVVSPDISDQSHVDPYEQIKITFKTIITQSIDGPEYKDSWNVRGI